MIMYRRAVLIAWTALIAVPAFADDKDTPKHESAKLEKDVPALDFSDLNDRSEIRGVIERYGVDRGSIQRALPQASPLDRDQKLRDFTKLLLYQLEKLDFDGLNRDGQVDYLLFKNSLDHDLRQLDIRIDDEHDAVPFVPFAKTILDLDEAKRELKPMDWTKTAGTLNQLTKDIAAARKEIDKKPKEETKVKKGVANRSVAYVESLRTALRTWNTFYDGYDPMYSWWNKEPYKAADSALSSYATFLRDKLGTSANAADEGRFGGGGGFGRGGFGGGGGGGGGGGRGGARDDAAGGEGGTRESARDNVVTPIGRDAMMSELAYEMISYTPEQLIDIAKVEFAWCEEEMKKASREMGFGEDWKAALEKVKTHYVEPGKQPALIRDLANEAVAYLDANDLVTIPPLCRESWRMNMMSPELQLVNPFFTGGEVISVSFPTDTMTHEAKMMSMRGNNIHFSHATVHHELIPGHHLEGFMSSRNKTYRRVFSTPFVVEGWALYWELLLWDKGFSKTPEDKIGMLFWRMHRCARIIFSLSYHMEKMSSKECVDFLVDRVGHERDNAAAEVRRSFNGSYPPLYQAAYLLGGFQFYALHKQLVDSGKMTDRAFHDMVLKQNRIPVDMIRAAMTTDKLSRDYKPDWKFRGTVPVTE